MNNSNKNLGYASGNSAVRPVIEVPYDSIELDNQLVVFDIMPTAMRTYFDNIDTWAQGQTDSSHASYDSAMSANLTNNDCVYFTNDNRDTEYNHTYCDQPNKYNTGVNGQVDVYLYDESNKTVGAAATYVTSDRGILYNFIPNLTYYWEDHNDSSVHGYIKPVGERRILSIDNVIMNDNTATSSTKYKMRNVRDLGGIPVTYTDLNNQSVTGHIQYGRLFRGEKIWKNYDSQNQSSTTAQLLGKLGIQNEMDLRAKSEKDSAASTEDDLANKLIGNSPNEDKTFEIIHYGIDYGGYDVDDVHYDYYDLSHDALKLVMEEFVDDYKNGNNDYALFFHCRIGADRTGTLAYLIEGILGVSEEDRYRDYELTVFFGLRERTRFYLNKSSNYVKFQHLKAAIRNAGDGVHEDVVTWYLKDHYDPNTGQIIDQTAYNTDLQLIDDFRKALIDAD